MKSKTCNKCHTEKSTTEFYTKTYKNKTSISHICKTCSNKISNNAYSALRDYKFKLKRKYNLTYEEYLTMYEEQLGKCSICSKDISLAGVGADKQTVAAVDHCHNTGKVRSLLCHACNAGIGHLKEDKNILNKAIEYLRKHNV